MNIPFIIWSIGAITCVVLELSFPGFFFFLSLALGAFFAALATAGGLGITEQWIIFTVLTFISFIVLKQWVKRSAKNTLYQTNAYALLGKEAVVKEEISRYKRGWVSVEGEQWAAQTEEEEIYTPGDVVHIVEIRGAHVVVKKDKNKL